MVDRKFRPIVPTEHTDEREHRRLLAERASASFPKDGTEGMAAPLTLQSITAAELTGPYAASLWPGASVYVSDENKTATSNGSTWVRGIDTTGLLTDPNADRIVFWDDSAGQLAYLRPNTGLAISGTDLNATLTSPVSVANGGTGQTTEAEALGEMIQALNQDTAPLPTDFLVSYDASADTGVKIALGNCGGMQLLTSGSVSAATLSLVLTAYTAFRGLKFVLNLIPATDGQTLNCRVSTNGGSSYDAAAGNYSYVTQRFFDTGGTLVLQSASATEMIMSDSIGNGATEGCNYEVTLMNQASTARWPQISWTGSLVDNTATPIVEYNVGAGTRRAAQDTDAIRFYFSSGNIVGNYAAYGLH